MSRFKLILLAVTAVLSVSAVASASASASSFKLCSPSGTLWVFCDHTGLELGTPPVLVLGVSHLSLLTGEITGVPAKLHCLKDNFHGWLLLLGKSHATIWFLTCTVIEPVQCKLPAAQEKEIEAKALDLLSAHPAAPKDIFVGSKNAITEEFASFTLESKTGQTCAVAGTYPVTGETTCELPGATVSKVDHEIECKKAGSHLFLGSPTNKATFSSTALVHLASLLPWLIMLGF